MENLDEWRQTEEEKAHLAEKIAQQLGDDGLDAILAVGGANVTYLSGGIVFPYLDQKMVQPVAIFINYNSAQAALFCSHDLAGIPKQMGWNGSLCIYTLSEADAAASLANAIMAYLSTQGSKPARIGVDGAHMTKEQLDALRVALPDQEFVFADDSLRSSRLCKTPGELRLVEAACRAGDRGFISALNHTEGAALDTLSYPVWEYGERFRVHVGEYGGSGVGNLCVAQGERARDLYAETDPYATFTKGELVRMEFSSHFAGYWMAGSRTVSIGNPDDRSRKSWAENRILRNAAIDTLQVGKRACDVYAAVLEKSVNTGIAFWKAADVGHGVGAAEREAPFLAPYDKTELAPGMTIAVAVYTFGPNKELICDKDVFLVTTEGPELLTWYKDFSELYGLFGTSARHG